MLRIEYPKGRALEDFRDQYIGSIMSKGDFDNNSREWESIKSTLGLTDIATYKELLIGSFDVIVDNLTKFVGKYNAILSHIKTTVENIIDAKVESIPEDSPQNKRKRTSLLNKKNLFLFDPNNNVPSKDFSSILKELDDCSSSDNWIVSLKKIKKLFDYDSYSEGIRSFFSRRSELLKIRTCFYCNISYIDCFKNDKGNIVGQFDLDHFLPKSKYPIVGLSLFNFVPSCGVCNSGSKGATDILEIDDVVNNKISPQDAYRLSPTWNGYNFDDTKRIVAVGPNSDKKYNISFENLTSDGAIYDKEVDCLNYNNRYQSHEIEAREIIRLKEKYTSRKVVEIIKDLMPELYKGEDLETFLKEQKEKILEIQEDIFRKEFMKNNGRAFLKLYNDILGDEYL